MGIRRIVFLFSLGVASVTCATILEAIRWEAGDYLVNGEDVRNNRGWENTVVYGQTASYSLMTGREWQMADRILVSAAPISPDGFEIRRRQQEILEEVHQGQEQEYQQQVESHHLMEWEYLNLPVRKYPEFYTLLKVHNLLPGIEEMASGMNRIFWILSGACIMAGLVWRMAVAGDSRQALQAILVCLMLIVVMGATGSGLRWLDDFTYQVADGLGNLMRSEQMQAGEEDYLVQVLTGVKTSLERARERIWREQDSSRAKTTRSFFEPLANTIRELMDFLFKSVYYVVCWVLDFILVLALLIVVLAEQLRLFLLYLGYGISPVLIGALAMPSWQHGVRVVLQNLLGVIAWPVGWVVCFLCGNLASRPLIYAFNDIPDDISGEWFSPQVLGTYVWNAYYTDQHSALAGLAMGVVLLCAGLLIGMVWITSKIQKMVSGGGEVMMRTAGGKWMQSTLAYFTGGAGQVVRNQWSGGKQGSETSRGKRNVDPGSMREGSSSPGSPRGHSIRAGRRATGTTASGTQPTPRALAGASTVSGMSGIRQALVQRGRQYLTRKVRTSLSRRVGGML